MSSAENVRFSKKVRLLQSQGRHKEALREHIRFHDRSKKPPHTFSIWLFSWMELADNYAPARAALATLRDRTRGRLVGGELKYSLFQDIRLLNEYFDEPRATAELFKELERRSPQFAARHFSEAEKALVEACEYAVARKHYGDPNRHFAELAGGFGQCMDNIKENSGLFGKKCALMRRGYRRLFVEDVLRLIAVLLKTREKAAARDIQAKALQVRNVAAIRNAL